MNTQGPSDTHDKLLIAEACAQVQLARANAASGSLDRLKAAGMSGSGCLPGRTLIDLQPDAIDGYEIVAERHRGGQGVVYEAVQKATKRRVAIKVLFDHPGGGSAGRLRFAREVEILGQLRHPNVVTIHDSSEVGGRFFYVMDFVDGLPMDAWIARRDLASGGAAASGERGAPTAESAASTLRLFVKVCDAVQAAHVRGVIHRDLKPGNILVDAAGEPRVVDFGLAKLADGSSAAQEMTLAGQFVGTLPWSSPEQIAGDPGQVDMRSDVYALGVLLFQMLTGRFPYPVTGPPAETMNHIRSRDPARPSSLRRGLDAEVDTLVLKCLQKDPGRRYQTAGELGRDIDRYLCGQPLDARRDSTAYVLRKYMARYRWFIAVAVGFAAVITTGFVVSLALWHRADTERAKAQRRFDQVRDLAHAFLFDLHDLIAPLAGSTQAREFMVRTGINYLDELAAAAGDDASLQLELAAAYDRVGDVQGSKHTPGGHLGDPAGALGSYEKALAIRAALAATRPGDAAMQYELGGSRERIGNVLYDLGRWDEALAAYNLFHEMVAARQRRSPADDSILADVAVSDERIGNVLVRLQRFEEALIRYREALRTRTEIATRFPPPALGIPRAIAVGHEKIGSVLMILGQVDEALAMFRACLQLREELAATDPDNGRAQRDLCVGYGRVGQALLEKGDHVGALAMQAEALRIAEKLAAADAANLQAQRDLAVCCEDVGNVHFAAGRHADALALYQRRLQISEAVYRADPESTDSIFGLLFSYYRLGHTHAALAGDPAAAAADQLTNWRAARDHFQRCHDFLVEMLDAGRLDPEQRALLDEPASQIERCKQAIAALEAAAPAPANN